MKRAFLPILLVFAAAGVPADASGQTIPKEPAYPTKPIRFVVPFARDHARGAGGSPFRSGEDGEGTDRTGQAETWRAQLWVIERLNKEFDAVLQMPDIRKRHAAAGSTVTGGTPEQFYEYLKSELAKFGKLIKEAGIKAETGS